MKKIVLPQNKNLHFYRQTIRENFPELSLRTQYFLAQGLLLLEIDPYPLTDVAIPWTWLRLNL